MNEQKLVNLIEELLNDAEGDFIDEGDNLQIRDFRQSGVMSRDAGLVIKIDGKEFQLTIVRSK